MLEVAPAEGVEEPGDSEGTEGSTKSFRHGQAFNIGPSNRD